MAGQSPGGPSVLRRLNNRITKVIGLWSERFCYRPSRLRAAAAVSRVVVGQIERHYPRLPVFLTPKGVDAGRFSADEESRRSLRSTEAIGDEEVIVLFVGGWWDHKGLTFAIQGLRHAVEAGVPSLRLWVVGRGDPQPYVELAGRLRVADRVRFFGFRRDTESFYQAADLLVLPSVYEASPLVVYEAAGSGLPVAATRVSGADVLEHEKTGLIIDRDEEMVGEAMARLASDPTLRRRLGDAARSRVRELTWDASAASVLSVYRMLLPVGPPGTAPSVGVTQPSR